MSSSSVIRAGCCVMRGPGVPTGNCDLVRMAMGSLMWISSLSMMGVMGGGGWVGGGGSMGTDCGGVSPRRSNQRFSMACSLVGGDSWAPLMADVSAWVAAMMWLVAVMVGTGIAWCLK